MNTFSKILVANRGEIAVRVIRAAQKSGILAVAVFAADDAESLHVAMADEAFALPGHTLDETYLNQHRLIQIALESDAQAIHPGYGFLSESADFAQQVSKAGLVFIGPSPENIWLMGEKTQALAYVQSLGLPVLPSFHGTVDQLIQRSPEMQFPVMVKASGGGGGKGMVICHSEIELLESLQVAERQAITYFGNGDLFVEKYLPQARHIEVQLMADHHGNIVHFYERECTMQRRFQKIIEEAPSSSIDEQLRSELTSAAVSIARSMNYRNAGTIEFLLDEKGRFYFLEMNTRIQVEHPVTEIITNTDLVALQLLVAAGNPLPMLQEDIQIKGHAIEIRLCAEDAMRNFLPSAGQLTLWDIPELPGVRIETFVSEGMTISPNYDSLLAKIIVGSENRGLAIGQMENVLSNSYIAGVHTNVSFLSGLISSKAFGENKIYTRYVDQNLEAINAHIQEKRENVNQHPLVIAWIIFHFQQREHLESSVWTQIGFWRMTTQLNVWLEGKQYQCLVEPTVNGQRFRINEQEYFVSAWQLKGKWLEIKINQAVEKFICMEANQRTLIGTQGFLFELQSNNLLNQAKVDRRHQEPLKVFQNLICADLFGKVLKLNISEGEVVHAGQLLLTLESMKTEIHVLCPVDAQVKKIHTKEGCNVLEKQSLIELEPILIPDLSHLDKGANW
ncbi:MAG TPA: biotin carboxylase N-terminal domain-containing protein [Prolixibacteraceae bacterium]